MSDMSKKLISISLSSDVAQLLADNGIDLLTELQRQRLDVTRGGPSTPTVTSTGSKSAELVILASAAAAPMIGTGIARVIDALGRYRAIVTQGAGPSAPPSEQSTNISLLGLKVELTDKYK